MSARSTSSGCSLIYPHASSNSSGVVCSGLFFHAGTVPSALCGGCDGFSPASIGDTIRTRLYNWCFSVPAELRWNLDLSPHFRLVWWLGLRRTTPRLLLSSLPPNLVTSSSDHCLVSKGLLFGRAYPSKNLVGRPLNKLSITFIRFCCMTRFPPAPNGFGGGGGGGFCFMHSKF